MTDIYSGSTLRLGPIAMKVGNGENRRKQLFFDPDSTPDCKVEEFQTFEVVDDLGTREFILAATPSAEHRKFPSDYLPASIDECAADELIPEAITRAIRIRPNDSFDGPCYRALLDYLKSYVGTPHERDVWNHYYDWGRPQQDKLPLIERAAEKAGLSTWEYIAHKTLQELKRFVQANGIPARIPDASPTVAADDRSGQRQNASDGERFAELRRWARDNLKGNQRRVVVLMIENDGQIPLSDLASEIGWEPPFDNAFNSIRKHLNKKLRNVGWKVSRHDNHAQLEAVKSSAEMHYS